MFKHVHVAHAISFTVENFYLYVHMYTCTLLIMYGTHFVINAGAVKQALACIVHVFQE